VVVLEGRAPQERVCAMNTQASQKGIVPGMTRLEVEAIGGVQLLARSIEGEASAHKVFVECAASFSPRMEDASAGTQCALVLDIAGTERLFGPPQSLAERLRAAFARAGFRTSVAVSTNFDAACMKAFATRGIAVIAEGEEAQSLSKLPVAALGLAEEHQNTFALWGIRTLGELAKLPETEMIARLGQGARMWRERALGTYAHTFQPMEPDFLLREFCSFETEIDDVESLLFVGARMIDCLVSRSARRAMSLTSLTVRMALSGGAKHRLEIRPALPTIDRKFLLKLLQLEIAANPPAAAVTALTVTAEAGQSSKVQMGLFAPQTPEPSRLDITIARLKAIAGEDSVGTPVLEDAHRDGSFHMESFAADGRYESGSKGIQRTALRRMRPPVPVQVVVRAHKPAMIHDGKQSYRVKDAFGPWRSSGCWWSISEWEIEQWDVLAEAQDKRMVVCLLVLDCARKQWQIEAVYD
jgi:protein ImuB